MSKKNLKLDTTAGHIQLLVENTKKECQKASGFFWATFSL